MESNQANQPDSKPPKKQPNTNFKYYSAAIQMVVTVVVSVFLGKYADEYVGNEKPYITILFTFMAIIGSLVSLIRKVMKG